MFTKNFLKLVLSPLILLGWLGASAVAQGERGAMVSKLPATNTVRIEPTSGRAISTNALLTATGGYESVSFETLAAYDIKVDWLINPTNSSLDTVRREGNIPDSVRLLHGKKVTLQGYIKPLKQDVGEAMEFLLMRDHALCCQTNIPQINEWVHVRMTGQSVPFAHERQFTVSGVLQVGELLGTGNVVSVYRLTGDGITPADAP